MQKGKTRGRFDRMPGPAMRNSEGPKEEREKTFSKMISRESLKGKVSDIPHR